MLHASSKPGMGQQQLSNTIQHQILWYESLAQGASSAASTMAITQVPHSVVCGAMYESSAQQPR